MACRINGRLLPRRADEGIPARPSDGGGFVGLSAAGGTPMSPAGAATTILSGRAVNRFAATFRRRGRPISAG
jgi:hypothetical protein